MMIEREMAGPGLRTFFRICEKWRVLPEQQVLILGCRDGTTLDAWLRGDYAEVSDDVLIRISYVLGIYKALHTIFPDERNADSWVTAPNSAPLLAGRSAIDLMVEGGVGGLASVRNYLEAQVNS
ncbi:MbcA/ParS/Xre antitoxin family protein [Thermomonas sp.]|uniref:MbcA/ParS/Xre antitoxin family protein n=1 Tax=Thermomonas sp. TaxID=1971895 RepID=UPI00391CAC93